MIECLSSFSTVVLYNGSSINHATKYIEKADIGSYISEVYSVKIVIPKSKFKNFEIVKRDFNLKTIKQILHFDDDIKYLKDDQEGQFVCTIPFDHRIFDHFWWFIPILTRSYIHTFKYIFD